MRFYIHIWTFIFFFMSLIYGPSVRLKLKWGLCGQKKKACPESVEKGKFFLRSGLASACKEPHWPAFAPFLFLPPRTENPPERFSPFTANRKSIRARGRWSDLDRKLGRTLTSKHAPHHQCRMQKSPPHPTLPKKKKRKIWAEEDVILRICLFLRQCRGPQLTAQVQAQSSWTRRARL